MRWSGNVSLLAAAAAMGDVAGGEAAGVGGLLVPEENCETNERTVRAADVSMRGVLSEAVRGDDGQESVAGIVCVCGVLCVFVCVW